MRTSRETIASITDVSTIGQRASSRILRNKTNGVIDAPFKQEKVLVQKQTTLRSTIPRVALTNVTNKTIDNVFV